MSSVQLNTYLYLTLRKTAVDQVTSHGEHIWTTHRYQAAWFCLHHLMNGFSVL
jgi:hypothetical protein